MGYISGSLPSFERASVMLFAVDPKFRGMGVGTKLIEALKMSAVMSGRYSVQLEVRSGSDAVSFYERRGFRQVGYSESFYNDGGSAIHMVSNATFNS